PGTWNVRVAREGYETLERTLTLRSGESFNLPLEWRATLRTIRRLKIEDLRLRGSAAGDAAFSAHADAPPAAILSFRREYAASPEARAARELLPRLQWPLDRLDGTQLADEAWQIPEAKPGETSQAKPVAVIGDGRLKFWDTITAIAGSPDGAL